MVSGSCILKLIGQKFISLLYCHFLLIPFVFTLAENMVTFTWLTLAKMHSAVKSDNIIERERSIKAAEKDLSAAVVTSICSTGAAVLCSVKCD